MDDLSDFENNDGSHDEEKGSATKGQQTSIFSRLNAVDELGSILHDTLQLKEENSSVDSDGSLDNCDINWYGSPQSSHKCLQKSENDSYTRALSLPTPDNLISAMKGSREKEGKLSVSWAPDVYDPRPSSLTPLPKQKIQLQYTKSNKKHGKGKQKGKTMKGGGSGPKDKKHYQKIGGKSDRCLNSYADTDRVMSSKNQKSSAQLLDDYDDYDVYGYDDY